ncbi:hypothetical protein NDU88_011276, partial [Pleurodeles waltl]
YWIQKWPPTFFSSDDKLRLGAVQKRPLSVHLDSEACDLDTSDTGLGSYPGHSTEGTASFAVEIKCTSK